MLEALDAYQKKQQETADVTTAATDQQVQAFETYTDEFGQVWTVVGGILGKVKGDLNDTALFANVTGQTIQTAFGRAFKSAAQGADDLSRSLGRHQRPENRNPVRVLQLGTVAPGPPGERVADADARQRQYHGNGRTIGRPRRPVARVRVRPGANPPDHVVG